MPKSIRFPFWMVRQFFAFASPPKCWNNLVPCLLSSTSNATGFMRKGSGLELSASSRKSLGILAFEERLVVGPLRLACDELGLGSFVGLDGSTFVCGREACLGVVAFSFSLPFGLGRCGEGFTSLVFAVGEH